ncbi:MAG TPA: CBS domain-containing protein [Blastocatellia bacterium]|nr:CBS domain-containing protein [Blastocatellia bacterium]
MKVNEVMRTPVITVREDATLEAVIEIMLNHRILGLPVTNGFGDLVGIITESDFVIREANSSRFHFQTPRIFNRCTGEKEASTLYGVALTSRAQDLMTTPVVTVTEQDSLEQVIKLMLAYDIGRIPVLRGKIPVGIVTCHDLLELMARRLRQERAPEQVPEPIVESAHR